MRTIKYVFKVMVFALFFMFSANNLKAQYFYTISEIENLLKNDFENIHQKLKDKNYIDNGKNKPFSKNFQIGNYALLSTDKPNFNTIIYKVYNPKNTLIQKYKNELFANYKDAGNNSYSRSHNSIPAYYCKFLVLNDYLQIIVMDMRSGEGKQISNEEQKKYENEKVNSKNSNYAIRKSMSTVEINSYTNATDIKFKKGDKIYIKATGHISLGIFAGSTGPNGIDGYSEYSILKELRHGCLMASIGNNEWFAVGESSSFIADKDDYLGFMVNDKDGANNSGSFIVEYAINKPLNSTPTKPVVNTPTRTQSNEQTYTQPVTEPAKSSTPPMTDAEIRRYNETYDNTNEKNPLIIEVNNEIKAHEETRFLYYKLLHPLYRKSNEYKVGSQKYKTEIEKERTDKIEYELKNEQEKKIIEELKNKHAKIRSNEGKNSSSITNNSEVKSTFIKSYNGTITNKTINSTTKCQITFSKNSDGTFQLKGELDKIKLVGKWDLKGKLIEKNVYIFKGDIILGYEGTEFPKGTSAPITITVSIDDKIMKGNYSIQSNGKNFDSQEGVFTLY